MLRDADGLLAKSCSRDKQPTLRAGADGVGCIARRLHACCITGAAEALFLYLSTSSS